MAKVIAVEQQKGGVGKSNVTVNLSGALTTLGNRVLVIDWDPQGDISRMYWPTPPAEDPDGHSLAATLLGQWEPEHPGQLTHTHSSGVHVIPSQLDMVTLEMQLYQVRAREFRLAQFVTWLISHQLYDHILIDCPPALGLLGDNATVATGRGRAGSGVLSVAAPWPIIFGNLELFHMQLAAVRSELNVDAPVLGMVVNMFDKRQGAMAVQSHRDLAARGDYWLTIGQRAVIAEAAAAGQTLHEYAPGSEAAGWYLDLGRLVDGQPPITWPDSDTAEALS